VSTDKSYEWRKQLMWGLALIALGVAIFLDQMDLVDIHSLWHYWPLLLVIAGVNKMIGYPTAKDFTSGLWSVLIGLWIFAVFEDMYGLTWRNSWPFVIIVTGITIILEPLIKKRFAPNEELKNEK
jgi:FtsH-binding integral membrane protein